MMKKIFLGLFALGLATGASAQQDKHYSMFAESPVYMNPATAGFFPGQMQVFTNFRMQWLTVSDNPYRTISASIDWRMLDRGNFMGMGINFYNDMAGDGQYMINEVTVPINYAIEVAKDNHISIGLQPAWYSRTMLSGNLTWDNQWTGTEFNTGISSGESILSQPNLNINKFDLSAGVYWYAHLNKEMRISLGIAGHHLTKQKVNILDVEDGLWRKLTVHGQMRLHRRNSNMTLLPAFYGFIQGPNMALTMGSNFRFLLRGASQVTGYWNEMALSFGGYYRLGDAIIANVIFDLSGLSVGASYDFNISSLTPATGGVGGFEFFLRYRLSFQRRGLGNPSIY